MNLARPRILAFLLALVGLVGCGGRGVESTARVTGRSRAVLKILWPERGRLIPNAANSLVVKLSKSGTVVQRQTIARPTTGQTQTQTAFNDLPIDTFDVSVQAFPSVDGSGVAQASGTSTMTTQVDVPAGVTVSLASSVATLTFAPGASSVVAGSNLAVAVSAQDASGNIVLLSAGGGSESLAWTTGNAAVATVSGTGPTATLTGVATGTTTVTASLTTDDAGTQIVGTESVTVSSAGSSGALRPNAIYFGHFYGDASIVTSMLPDGTGRQDSGGGASNVVCAFPDPVNAGKTIYAFAVNGSYGVYRGTTFDPSTSDVLAPPTYDGVTALQPAANGAVLVVASTAGTSHAYLLAGGTVQTIDEADTASVSLDGSTVVYTKVVGNNEQMFVWTAAGSSQMLAVGMDALFPSFSRDGTSVVFSSDANGGTSDAPWDLYQIPTSGGTIVQLTNTPELNEFGAAFDESGTNVAFVGQGFDPNDSGVYVLSGGTETRIATDADVSFATYWTTSTGRASHRAGGSTFVQGARFQRLVLPRKRRS